jgi:hypothetical protein
LTCSNAIEMQLFIQGIDVGNELAIGTPFSHKAFLNNLDRLRISFSPQQVHVVVHAQKEFVV